ncbi:MAG: DUF423 domain-containing protein [Planctomycetota bacterium]
MIGRNAWFVLGAVNGGLSVAAGAFGAHGLRHRLTAEALGVFETAARYHMYHALALLAVGWIASHGPPRLARLAGGFHLAGIVLFSGSLYALSLTGMKWLGAVTPLGGVSFLLGWLMLALAAAKQPGAFQSRGA